MLQAMYYDGRSTRAYQVTLSLEAGALTVRGVGIERREALAAVDISEPLRNLPRQIRFADGAYCEAPEGPALAALLAAGGHREGVVAVLQSRWPVALAALIGVLAIAVAGYLWGLPWAAERLAPRVPAAWAERLSAEALATLDEHLFEASALPAARQRALTQGASRIAGADPALPGHRLVFRSAPRLGANALALPDGTVVVLDDLVALGESDAEVLAVIAHELGHVAHRHGLRQMIQSSVVALAVGAWLGDVSGAASALTTVLLQTGYSREFEREADHYGAALLRRNGMSPQLLASMLEKLERAHGAGRGSASRNSIGGYLSTHPETARRIEVLRGAP